MLLLATPAEPLLNTAMKCNFEECPIGEDITDVSGFCTDSKGAVCGPIAAYGMLSHQLGSLAELEEDPITATFTFSERPDGYAPVEIRDEWVGVSTPVRYPESLDGGVLEITHADLVLTLLSNGKVDAASWFIKFEASNYMFGNWQFEVPAGKVELLDEPIHAKEFYGSRLSADQITFIEQA